MTLLILWKSVVFHIFIVWTKLPFSTEIFLLLVSLQYSSCLSGMLALCLFFFCGTFRFSFGEKFALIFSLQYSIFKQHLCCWKVLLIFYLIILLICFSYLKKVYGLLFPKWKAAVRRLAGAAAGEQHPLCLHGGSWARSAGEVGGRRWEATTPFGQS